MKNNTQLTLTEQDLSTVDSFKAIVAQGNKRIEFKKQQHKELIYKKYEDGKNTQNHITLFRVNDKKGLPPKEKDNHIVKGPYWTPPSSVGFVLGAMSKDLRVWLASDLDYSTIKQSDGKPAIYAREIISPILSGWTPRPPHDNEKYGRTDRAPKVVLTPPTERKVIESEKIQKIMNVDNS